MRQIVLFFAQTIVNSMLYILTARDARVCNARIRVSVTWRQLINFCRQSKLKNPQKLKTKIYTKGFCNFLKT